MFLVPYPYRDFNTDNSPCQVVQFSQVHYRIFNIMTISPGTVPGCESGAMECYTSYYFGYKCDQGRLLEFPGMGWGLGEPKPLPRCWLVGGPNFLSNRLADATRKAGPLSSVREPGEWRGGIWRTKGWETRESSPEHCQSDSTDLRRSRTNGSAQNVCARLTTPAAISAASSANAELIPETDCSVEPAEIARG